MSTPRGAADEMPFGHRLSASSELDMDRDLEVVEIMCSSKVFVGYQAIHSTDYDSFD